MGGRSDWRGRRAEGRLGGTRTGRDSDRDRATDDGRDGGKTIEGVASGASSAGGRPSLPLSRTVTQSS